MEDEIVKRGYVHQQVFVTQCFRRQVRWERVFLLLKDSAMYLYSSPRDLHPLQTLPLYAACCLFPQAPKVARSNCLQIETPTDSLVLCAESPSDIKDWAIAIQKSAIIASGGTIGKLPTAAAGAHRAAASLSLSHGSGALAHPPEVTTLPPEALTSHSPEAATMIAEATASARFDRVQHRFRLGSEVNAFTSNHLACLADSYSKSRSQSKRRVAQEWMAEKRQHDQDNRQLHTPNARPIEVDVNSLGTLQLVSPTVRLQRGTGSLSVTNTADYPVVVRVGDRSTATWLRTNTPLFLAPAASSTITFATADASTSSSSSSSSSAAPSLQAPPALPCEVTLVLKACDPSDLASDKPQPLFESEDGTSTHRIGECCTIEITQ